MGPSSNENKRKLIINPGKMNTIKIATAQFENKSGDKDYNLKVIGGLSEVAAQQGANAVALHKCSITGYTGIKKHEDRNSTET